MIYGIVAVSITNKKLIEKFECVYMRDRDRERES